VLLAEERAGTVLDGEFIRAHTEGFEAWRAHLDALRFEDLVESSGLSREEMRGAAEDYARAERVIACWAMGLTQHRHAVANVQEIVNLMLLRGNLGRPGAGLCPVRGHSNVQGDRTMGIWERPPPRSSVAWGRSSRSRLPPGTAWTDGAIQAMQAGRAKVFLALGGNFLVASPDTKVTGAALSRCRLTAHVARRSRSHLVTGGRPLLPVSGARSATFQKSGAQFVTVENSMSVVHRSQGHLAPASEALRSEPAIVAELARATIGDRGGLDWEWLVEDYDRIRDRIARVIPGFADFNCRVREPGGFVLPSGPRAREFPTPTGKARFTVHATPRIALAPGQFLLMTIRSHDQFNTTVYSSNDRYRGISGDRRVVFLRADEISAAGLRADQRVDMTSHVDGETRTLRGFRVVPYDLPRRCAAAYYPEANALVPLTSIAEKSRTPTYKSIPVTLRWLPCRQFRAAGRSGVNGPRHARHDERRRSTRAEQGATPMLRPQEVQEQIREAETLRLQAAQASRPQPQRRQRGGHDGQRSRRRRRRRRPAAGTGRPPKRAGSRRCRKAWGRTRIAIARSRGHRASRGAGPEAQDGPGHGLGELKRSRRVGSIGVFRGDAGVAAAQGAGALERIVTGRRSPAPLPSSRRSGRSPGTPASAELGESPTRGSALRAAPWLGPAAPRVCQQRELAHDERLAAGLSHREVELTISVREDPSSAQRRASRRGRPPPPRAAPARMGSPAVAPTISSRPRLRAAHALDRPYPGPRPVPPGVVSGCGKASVWPAVPRRAGAIGAKRRIMPGETMSIWPEGLRSVQGRRAAARGRDRALSPSSTDGEVVDEHHLNLPVQGLRERWPS
jgi:hypothetical protein